MWNGGVTMNKWLYWIKTGLSSFIYVVLASIIYGIFMSLLFGEFCFDDVIYTILDFSTMLAPIMFFFINISSITFMINLAISLGETRKTCFLGTNVLNLTALLSCNAYIIALSILSKSDLNNFLRTLFVFIGIYLFSIGCGICVNSASNTISNNLNGFQSALLIISIIISIIMIMVLNGVAKISLEHESFLFSNNATLIIFIACYITGLILYIIGNIRMKKKIMQLEVSL